MVLPGMPRSTARRCSCCWKDWIVVAADAEAARALGAAYRQEVPLDGACRLFGRDAVAFKSFEHMLDDAQSKQAAWALLKKLPRFGER